VIARTLHRESRRVDGPFVAVNCAALSESLLESELFGHEKGAFTGAVAQKPGKLELADKGTVLLDEVGDMSLAAQAKLLRFLQDGELQHVGGNQAHKVEVRVIAATNKNLDEAIRQKLFRDDLFYRLSVVTIHVPPLRERKEDIPLLAGHFLEQACSEQAVSQKSLTDDAVALLAAQSWPGNVRELANTMQRCVVLLQQQVLSARDIEPLLSRSSDMASESTSDRSLKAAREGFERLHIVRVLSDCGWNVTEAARILGVDRTALYRIFDRLDIPTTKP
jgi:transcriptional regulator with GAF, ATPase, and Fis domain